MVDKIKSVYGTACKEIKWTKKFKAGYILQREGIYYDSSEKLIYLTIAYNLNGAYIGDSKTAHFICSKNKIVPELKTPNSSVCSIGYSESSKKWFGWSHRSIRGFKIGDTVKKEDDGYQPTNKMDFLEEQVNFWVDKYHLETKGKFIKNGVEVSWKYSNEVPNKILRGQTGNVFCKFPDKYGNGEWTAKNLDDCKKMAIAFADSVS